MTTSSWAAEDIGVREHEIVGVDDEIVDR